MAEVPGLDLGASDEELFDLVWRDDLTGLYNRRFFARFMKQQADWSEGAPPLALAMMDMDNLKRINDRLGHMAGDATLKRIGAICRETVKDGRYPVRYAGDEFALILPNMGRAEAVALADRLRQAVIKDVFQDANLPEGLHPSLSIGVAVFPDDAPQGGDELTEAADKALYYSKRTGKNKVTSASDVLAGADEVADIEALAGFPARTLVGREAAFRVVDDAFSLVLDGHNGLLLVEGEPGSGKTRLLAEIANYAKERELLVMIEKCNPVHREEPYRALTGVLAAFLKSHPDRREAALAALSPAQREGLKEVLPLGAAGGRSPSGKHERPAPPGPAAPPPEAGRPASASGRRPLPGPGPQPGRGAGPPPPAGRRPGPPGAPPAARRPGTQSGARPGPPPPGRGGPPQGRPRPPEAVRAAVPPSLRDSGELTVQVFTGLADLFASLSKDRAVVVLLDDLEHCDEATLELIARLLPRPGKTLFVGAARTRSEKRPGAESRDGDEAPYVAFRRSLDEHPNVLKVDLSPLDRALTIELASHLLDGWRPPVSFADRLHQVTRGNPLYVEGVLRHLIDTGVLARGGDGWRFTKTVPAELPVTLEDLLRQHLKVLSPATAELVSQAAVVGPNFEFNVLRASRGDQGGGDTLDLLDEAVRADVLEETGSDEGPDVQFRSTAEAETAYEELEPKARQEVHRRVGEVLEKQPPPAGKKQPEAAALAYHFDKAGDRQKRDRFLELVRARREQVFDREAIESLGDGRRTLIPEVSEPAPPELAPILPELARALATAAKVVKMYPATSKVVQENMDALVAALSKAFELVPAFTLSHRGNALVLNGQPVDKEHADGQFQEAVAGIFRTSSIKSLTFVRPAAPEELVAFLKESGGHSLSTPIPRQLWSVFARDQGLKSLGIVQKTLVLQNRQDKTGQLVQGSQRVAETDLNLVKELLRHFMGALDGIKKYPPGSKVAGEALVNLDRTLRQVFALVPALAIHEGEEETLVVNGTALVVAGLGAGAAELLRFLRETRLRGLVLLRDLSPRELARFVTLLAKLGPAEASAAGDAAADKISSDGSFPNILVGRAMFQLARDLVGKPETEKGPAPTGAPAQQRPAPLVRDPLLPDHFTWPTDAMIQRAETLCQLKPSELISTQYGPELIQMLELVLLDKQTELAQRLVERLAINFASQEVVDRMRCADQFLELARKASQELRAAWFNVAVRRLGDALELEQNVDAFEKLAECAKLGILDRIAEGDWDVAARLVWSLGRRREGRGDAQGRVAKLAARTLAEVLDDPRAERVWETIETGSQQERRKAARVLEGMGTAVIDRLLRALMTTGRARVESFLIDMLAALAPESEAALQRQVTPFAPPEATVRLLRASAVVCQDPTVVLVTGLQHQDQVVQTEAVSVARGLGGKPAQKVLSWALQNGSPAAQLTAVRHLGELTRPDAVDELLDLLQKSTLMEVQREVCLAVGKMTFSRQHHEKVVPVLANLLRTGGFLRAEYPEDVRAAAAWALGQMKTVEAARKALEKVLEDKDKRVRLTAKLALQGRQ